ncbi:MAG: dicarboxylate/amino acid:cation symporter [Gammaproteobacteria bacterium]
MNSQFKSYYFPTLLLLCVITGGLTGHWLGKDAIRLKPFGDIFLNLIFTAIVPLIFFSIAAAVAHTREAKQLWKILSTMLLVFIITSSIAAIYMIFIVKLIPPAEGMILTLTMPPKVTSINIADQIVNIFTVSDFTKLLSHQNMLALIFFSFLVGLATAACGTKGKVFANFLQSGTDVFMKIISFIMYYAPIGFFAYFAALVGELGPTLLKNYFRVTLIYYSAASLYFIVVFSFFAYIAGKNSLKIFWKNVLIPMLTAFATCSSAASIPANLQATKNMGVPANIYETVIPLGTILHKDGSVLGAIIKIAFLFGIFHMSFSGFTVLITALLIALLVGTVMGAIPSGGMLGEMVILSLYGFPPQALIIIAAISIIIDPIATMLNVTGNTVCSLLITRIVVGRDWLHKKLAI